MPVFLTMTNGMSEEQRRAIVRRATIVSFLTLMVFTFSGQFLFKFFGISIKRVPYCGWHYHLHDRFRHVAGTLCESQAERRRR